MNQRFLIGALIAVPLTAQIGLIQPRKDPEMTWLAGVETKDDVAHALGRASQVADFGGDFISWQYQIQAADNHEFTHQVVIRRSTGALVSITRNFDPARNFKELFPAGEFSLYSYPDATKPVFRLLLRRLPGEKVLIVPGASSTAEPASQVVWMRRDEVRLVYPWLEEQLKARDDGRK